MLCTSDATFQSKTFRFLSKMMKFRTCLVRSCTTMLLSSRSVNSFAKEGFHLRNKHRFGYDLAKCVESDPALKGYIRNNKLGQPAIDFSDPSSVKALNGAMLKSCYGVKHWSIPDNYLCPSIPSRADYIHRIADLVNHDAKPGEFKSDVVGLDIGVGASCIYPIVGVTDYNWKFVGTDVDDLALQSAQAIVNGSPHLTNSVKLRKQYNPKFIFRGVVKKGDMFDFCVANPPFHASEAAAQKGSERKWRNLNKPKLVGKGGKDGNKAPVLNFGGASQELICDGGEVGFVSRMIRESADPFIRSRVKVFTSLVSSRDNLEVIYRILDKTPEIDQVYTVEMQHGQKKSRIVAWKYAAPRAVVRADETENSDSDGEEEEWSEEDEEEDYNSSSDGGNYDFEAEDSDGAYDEEEQEAVTPVKKEVKRVISRKYFATKRAGRK